MPHCILFLVLPASTRIESLDRSNAGVGATQRNMLRPMSVYEFVETVNLPLLPLSPLDDDPCFDLIADEPPISTSFRRFPTLVRWCPSIPVTAYPASSYHHAWKSARDIIDD